MIENSCWSALKKGLISIQVVWNIRVLCYALMKPCKQWAEIWRNMGRVCCMCWSKAGYRCVCWGSLKKVVWITLNCFLGFVYFAQLNTFFYVLCYITTYFEEWENIFPWLCVDVKICLNRHGFSSLRAASVTMHIPSALETSRLIQSVNIRVMLGLQLG